MSFSVLGPCELAATTDDMCHSFCMLFAQPTSWILRSSSSGGSSNSGSSSRCSGSTSSSMGSSGGVWSGSISNSNSDSGSKTLLIDFLQLKY